MQSKRRNVRPCGARAEELEATFSLKSRRVFGLARFQEKELDQSSINTALVLGAYSTPVHFTPTFSPAYQPRIGSDPPPLLPCFSSVPSILSLSHPAPRHLSRAVPCNFASVSPVQISTFSFSPSCDCSVRTACIHHLSFPRQAANY